MGDGYRGAHGVAQEVCDPRPLLQDGGETRSGQTQHLQLLLGLAQLNLQRPLGRQQVRLLL